MIYKELEDYVNARLGQGASREEAVRELKQGGWADEDVAYLLEESPQRPVAQDEGGVPVPQDEPVVISQTNTGVNRLPTGEKIGKFKASWMIVKGSWSLLKQDKEMMLFPVVSTILNLLIVGVFGVVLFFVVLGGDIANVEALEGQTTRSFDVVFYAVFFVLYIVSYFNLTFFETGVVAIAHGRMNGNDLSFKDGINTALGIIGKIFVWAVVAATVGMILRTIAERSKLLGRIVVWMLGALWSILAYFIVPVMLLEDLSVKDSLKKSAKVINTSWGEAVIVNFGVSAVFGVLGLLGFLVFLGAGIGLGIVTQGVVIPLIMAGLFILYIVVLGVISSTLGTVFKVVLYEYATKKTVPQGFSEELLYQAFKPKKSKK